MSCNERGVERAMARSCAGRRSLFAVPPRVGEILVPGICLASEPALLFIY